MRSAMSRHVTVDANRETPERPRSVRSIKSRTTHADASAAAIDLVTELLSQNLDSPDVARRAVERLQTRVRASKSILWSVTEKGATCLLTVANASPDAPRVLDDLSESAILFERLRRHPAVSCHSGEVSGFEGLVPAGVRSFVIAAGPGTDHALGVLVVGFDSPDPTCDQSAVGHLRVAAALLHRALTNHPAEQLGMADAILGSLADRIAVLDRDGTIVAANAAWTAFSRAHTTSPEPSTGRGASYFDLYRHAAANGSPEAASILEGLQAITRGESDFLQAAYPSYEVGEEQWCVLTATPLQHADRGAVVAHDHITSAKVIELARRMGEKLFHRLADAMPLPIWILSPDGHVIHGNRQWAEIANGNGNGNGNGNRTAEQREWTDVFHADDRERAIAAFRAGVMNRTSFELELRLRIGPGTYRWSVCICAPYVTVDGQLDSYVAFCCDSSPRQAESAFRETASKLVSAQEADRSHIGRELHDDLGQRAALVAAKLETLARHRRTPTGLRAGLVDAQDSLQDLAVAIHNLSHQLHPAKLRLLGLVITLEALCRDVSKENAVKVHFRAEGVPSRVPEPIALCLFRVAQEALQNAVKHSAAHDIDVHLSGATSRLVLRVKDQGRGFDPLTSEGTGIGLLTMRERVELSGGQLTIQAAVEQGTTIEAVLPLDHRTSDAA